VSGNASEVFKQARRRRRARGQSGTPKIKKEHPQVKLTPYIFPRHGTDLRCGASNEEGDQLLKSAGRRGANGIARHPEPGCVDERFGGEEVILERNRLTVDTP